ncbi:MAG: TetR/AcrR family transcriptional regulator [Candidatus Binatus sp.]|jgi:AcrR family transcriptional regulator|uniref:TetR/AcrR family transcriptional regulator n=1 Tax=Candidatus Binatus sp. TaxID=2811406 RepID=UPI003C777FA4
MDRTNTNSAVISNGRPFHVHDEQAAKRERILAAALKLFAHEPYQAVTMDRVAEAARVAKGTLYLYFPSKDALYLGVLSDGLDTAYRTYQASADPKLPVVERLRRSIGVMVEFFDQRRDFLQFYAMEEPRLSDARNRIIDGSRERGFNFFASLIEEGIRVGAFTRVDPRLATFTIQGAIRSLLLYYGAGRPVSELSRDLGNLMLRSLGADPSQPLKVVHPQ